MLACAPPDPNSRLGITPFGEQQPQEHPPEPRVLGARKARKSHGASRYKKTRSQDPGPACPQREASPVLDGPGRPGAVQRQ